MPKFCLKEKIEKCKKVHNNKYDYSLVDYKHSKTKIKIICDIHGVFEQHLVRHETGVGCTPCGWANKKYHASDKARDTYVDRAKKQHPHFDYSKTKYKNVRTKVTITCKEHGDWDTDPTKFLISLIGCPSCSRKNIDKLNREFGYGWNRSNWNECGKKSIHFDSFKVYVIKCWNENEKFYKIGRTYNKLNKRFRGKDSMPYKYKAVDVFEFENSDDAYDKELFLKKINKINKYVPLIEFGGRYECYQGVSII